MSKHFFIFKTFVLKILKSAAAPSANHRVFPINLEKKYLFTIKQLTLISVFDTIYKRCT